MESWFKSLKVERVNLRRYATREEARADIFWVWLFPDGPRLSF